MQMDMQVWLAVGSGTPVVVVVVLLLLLVVAGVAGAGAGAGAQVLVLLFYLFLFVVLLSPCRMMADRNRKATTTTEFVTGAKPSMLTLDKPPVVPTKHPEPTSSATGSH